MENTYQIKVPMFHTDRFDVTDEFVKNNNLKLERTQEEILKRIEWGNNQFFYFGTEILYSYLTLESATPFLNDEAKKEKEEGKLEWTTIVDVKEAVQEMLDYLNFGMQKALDERGLSASRTIHKMTEWFWLLGREDLMEIVSDNGNYNPYGAPALVAVAEALELPVTSELAEFANKPIIEQ